MTFIELLVPRTYAKMSNKPPPGRVSDVFNFFEQKKSELAPPVKKLIRLGVILYSICRCFLAFKFKAYKAYIQVLSITKVLRVHRRRDPFHWGGGRYIFDICIKIWSLRFQIFKRPFFYCSIQVDNERERQVIADISARHILQKKKTCFCSLDFHFVPPKKKFECKSNLNLKNRFHVTSSPRVTSQNMPDNSFGLVDYHV